MIPYILAAVGGYLIGQSRKDEQFADGGMLPNRSSLSKDTDVKHFKINKNFSPIEYSIKYFDGKTINIGKDGKPIYYLALFTNRSDFENFKTKLISEGYKFMGEYRGGFRFRI